MFILKRVLLGLVVTLLALGLVAVGLFYFGGPSTPAPGPAADTGATAAPSPMTGAPGDQRFIIEVPGCTCHSDDPAVVAEHATYRMSECSECH
jgi:hypothetical protein